MLAVGGALLGGCGNPSNAAPPTPSATPRPSPSASTTPTLDPTSTAVVKAYLDATAAFVHAELAMDPNDPALVATMTGAELSTVKKNLIVDRAGGLVARGDIKTQDPHVISVDGGTAVVRDCEYSQLLLYDAKSAGPAPGVAHSVIAERVQQRDALRHRVRDVEGHVLAAAVVPAQLPAGSRVATLEDADQVVALDPAGEAEIRRSRAAPDPRSLAPPRVVVDLRVGDRLLVVLDARRDGHDVADADHGAGGSRGQSSTTANAVRTRQRDLSLQRRKVAAGAILQRGRARRLRSIGGRACGGWRCHGPARIAGGNDARRLLAEMAAVSARAAASFENARVAMADVHAVYAEGRRAPQQLAAIGRAKAEIHACVLQLRDLHEQLSQLHEARHRARGSEVT